MTDEKLKSIEAWFEIERDMHPMADFPAEFYSLTAEIRKLRAALASLEWCRYVMPGWDGYCPTCGAAREAGHLPECALAIALS